MEYKQKKGTKKIKNTTEYNTQGTDTAFPLTHPQKSASKYLAVCQKCVIKALTLTSLSKKLDKKYSFPKILKKSIVSKCESKKVQ